MSKLIKEIQKAKSFDKRYSIIESNISNFSEEESGELCSLLLEVAKYDKHFGLIIFLIARPELYPSKNVIENIAYKITEIPEDAGGAMIVMHCLGMHSEAKKYFEEMLNNKSFENPNIKVQFVVFGTLIPYLNESSSKIIEILRSENPEWPDFLVNVPPYGSIPYMTFWMDKLNSL